MVLNDLFNEAKKAREHAYAPYSNFKVGSALITRDGNIYTGSNVENASYGLCNCAERTAIFKAVSSGETHFESLLIIADTEEPCPPCGACRQVISEFFSKNSKIIMSNLKGERMIKTVEQLLPFSFDKRDLKN